MKTTPTRLASPALAVLVVALVALVALSAPAAAAPVLVESARMNVFHNNCMNGGVELLGSAWVATPKDDATRQPKTGETFYVRAGFSNVGNVCGGAAYFRPELVLPLEVRAAIAPEAPVQCILRNLSTGQAQSFVCDDVEVSPGQAGGVVVENLLDAAGAWRVPNGSSLEVLLPVKSTRRSGAGASTVSLGGSFTYIADVSGVVTASVPLTVFRNPPSISFPMNAVSNVTHEGVTLEALVENRYNGGEAFFELGQGTFIPDNLGVVGPVRFESFQFQAFIRGQITSLPPETLVHWRVKFIADDGSVTVAPGGTFTTLPAPRYEVVTTSTAGGRVERSLADADYPVGTALTLTAVADAGFRFERFVVDGVAVTTPSVELVVERAHAVHAVFAEIPAPAPAPVVEEDEAPAQAESDASAPAPAPGADSAPAPATGDVSVEDSTDEALVDTPPVGGAATGDDEGEAVGCSSTGARDASFFVGLALVGLLGRRRRRA